MILLHSSIEFKAMLAVTLTIIVAGEWSFQSRYLRGPNYSAFCLLTSFPFDPMVCLPYCKQISSMKIWHSYCTFLLRSREKKNLPLVTDRRDKTLLFKLFCSNMRKIGSQKDCKGSAEKLNDHKWHTSKNSIVGNFVL